jgi:hypothetical protein
MTDETRPVALTAQFTAKARAYRLAWPEGTRLYEIDQPAALARKETLLYGPLNGATSDPRRDRPPAPVLECAIHGPIRAP